MRLAQGSDAARWAEKLEDTSGELGSFCADLRRVLYDGERLLAAVAALRRGIE